MCYVVKSFAYSNGFCLNVFCYIEAVNKVIIINTMREYFGDSKNIWVTEKESGDAKKTCFLASTSVEWFSDKHFLVCTRFLLFPFALHGLYRCICHADLIPTQWNYVIIVFDQDPLFKSVFKRNKLCTTNVNWYVFHGLKCTSAGQRPKQKLIQLSST